MPWCDVCARYWAPSAMAVDGTCPTCGKDVDTPGHEPHEDTTEDDRAPWHFKLLVVAAVAYLVWRFYQLFFG